MAQFIDTNRGGKQLHLEGYIYTKIRDGANGFQFWRCQNHKAGCPARATSEGRSVVVRKEHDHPPNPAQTTTQLAIAGMRKRAREESTSVNVIYDDQLEVLSQDQNSADVLAQLPSIESIRSSLYRARHENTPILPTHRRDISLSNRFTKSKSGEDLLLVDDGDDDKILIFATEQNLSLMGDADSFYIDGTFSTCPSLFYQVCYLLFHAISITNITEMLFFLSVGVHNPHSALWPYISDGILPFAQQRETDIQQSVHATQRCGSSADGYLL